MIKVNTKSKTNEVKVSVGVREVKQALNYFKKQGYEKWDAVDKVTEQFEDSVTYQFVSGVAKGIKNWN